MDLGSLEALGPLLVHRDLGFLNRLDPGSDSASNYYVVYSTCFSYTLTISQMSDRTWIEIALLGLLMVCNVSASPRYCSFDAAFTIIADRVDPPSIFEFADPQMSFYRDTLRFTEAETQQVMEAAIQHFNTQFGLDFSNIEPNDANQRFLGNGTFSSAKAPFNATAIANRWLVTGNKKSKCFDVGSGHFRVDFNGTMMLHGVYGGEDGRPVNAGDFVVYGHIVLFDTCPQQQIVIQTQTDIPARRLPVEGWIVEELQAYHRQLGRGRVQSTFKSRPSPDDPTMVVTENQSVVSFP